MERTTLTVYPSNPTDKDDLSGASSGHPDETQWQAPAPSLPVPFVKARALASAVSRLGTIGDFEIQCLLGEGAFGKVFRARQISLDREVAIKLTANLGDEGRTMARLQHPQIVQVFSESIDEERGLRVLCMQYVAGATLQQILADLTAIEGRLWNGQDILCALEASSDEPTQLDAARLHDRETLLASGHEQAVCWMGQQLAETLAYAHAQGVLHLDIKPANVLVNQYGQPMLTDFSVSLSASAESRAGAAVVGGTLGYMAPEHVKVFDPDGSTAADDVDQRSDIYSLGAVLLDLVTGRRQQTIAASTSLTSSGRLGIIAQNRDSVAMSESLSQHHGPPALTHIVRRCLRTNPGDRFQRATDLADSLKGCRDLLQAQESLPTAERWTHLASVRPVLFILLFTILPNLAAAALNITYIATMVIHDLSPAQRSAFWQMLLWYNVAVIAVMAVMVHRTLIATARGWQRLRRGEIVDDDDVAELRRRTLTLPAWSVVLACVGWLPFSLVIPLGMDWLAGPVERGVLWHICVAYFLTGMMALVCNYFIVSFVVLRALYLQQWRNPANYRRIAVEELQRTSGRNRLMQVLAGLTPLAAAAFLVVVGPEQFTPSGFRRFRILLFVLLAAGVFGSWLANWWATRLNQYVAELTASKAK